LGWSYDATQLATSKLYQVRRMVGDVLSGDPQLQDEEINFIVSSQPSDDVYLAAAEACRNLAAQYSRKASTTTGPVHTTYDNQARAYAQRAVDIITARRERLDIMGVAPAGSSGSPVSPLCGGVRGPQFSIGMFDVRGDSGPPIGHSRGYPE
jgi:hypothetical protein